MTIRAGVVGSPAKHSLSPLIHGAWLQAAGIDGEYGLYDLPPDGFAEFLSKARADGLAGVNVTVPFKEQALAAADRPSDLARRSAAANVLLFRDGLIEARNTDGAGLLAALVEQAPNFAPAGAKVALLGAGGAARGAAAALQDAGASVFVVNRTHEKAERLAADLSADRRSVKVQASSLTIALTDADLVVNATSASLLGASLVGQQGTFDLSAAPTSAVVMDMVYKPLVTPFLADARARGHVIVDGLAMLIGQARPSFEAFFGRTPPSNVDVRALCLAELERRG